VSGLALPGILGEIAEIAGEAAAMRVAQEKGGTRAYIPAPDNLPPTHWLVQAAGAEGARAIAARFGGGPVPVPLGPTGSRGRTWTTIRRALDEGASAAEAARLAGVDEKTVRRHRTRKTAGLGRVRDSRQGDLF
jgi:hypothetical protein